MMRFLTSTALFVMILASATGCHTTTSNRVPCAAPAPICAPACPAPVAPACPPGTVPVPY